MNKEFLDSLMPVTDYGLTYLALRTRGTDKEIINMLTNLPYQTYGVFAEIMFCCMEDVEPYMRTYAFQAFDAIERRNFVNINLYMLSYSFRGENLETLIVQQPNAWEICERNSIYPMDRKIVQLHGDATLVNILRKPLDEHYLLRNPRLTLRDIPHDGYKFVPPIHLIAITNVREVLDAVNRDPTITLRYMDVAPWLTLMCCVGVRLPRGVAGIIICHQWKK